MRWLNTTHLSSCAVPCTPAIQLLSGDSRRPGDARIDSESCTVPIGKHCAMSGILAVMQRQCLTWLRVSSLSLSICIEIIFQFGLSWCEHCPVSHLRQRQTHALAGAGSMRRQQVRACDRVREAEHAVGRQHVASGAGVEAQSGEADLSKMCGRVTGKQNKHQATNWGMQDGMCVSQCSTCAPRACSPSSPLPSPCRACRPPSTFPVLTELGYECLHRAPGGSSSLQFEEKTRRLVVAAITI